MSESLWKTFRDAGMVKICNEALAPHGWALVLELGEDGEIVDGYPGTLAAPRVVDPAALSEEDRRHLARLEALEVKNDEPATRNLRVVPGKHG